MTGADLREPLWESMALTYVGSVGEVLQGGGGKLSPNCGDPGDPRKPKGQEPPPCNPEENNPTHHPPPGG